jgi:SAM-dependent methyltransferase
MTDVEAIVRSHCSAYTSLAHEYEARVQTLHACTERAVSGLAAHLPLASSVLDVGCGTGSAMRLLRRHGYDVQGIDISPAMLSYARRRNPGATLINSDFISYEFDCNFDGVIALAFIHLYPQDIATGLLSKMFALLRVGGVLYVGTTKSSHSIEGFRPKVGFGSRVHRFRKDWLQTDFENALLTLGFQIVSLEEIVDPYDKIWMDYVAKRC